jgi:hypothetical protein
MLSAIEQQVCHGQGFGDNQRVSAVHSDTDNLHVHMAGRCRTAASLGAGPAGRREGACHAPAWTARNIACW